MPTTTRLNVVIPKDTQQQFRIACIEDGVTMSDKVVELIKIWLDSRKK